MTVHFSQEKVRLRSMTQDEYLLWFPRQTAAYAVAKVTSGNWNLEEARDLALKQMHELLPDGLRTKNHSIFSVESVATNDVVGVLWINIKENSKKKSAFIYDIEMDEKWRGQGFGSATLKKLEEMLRLEGVESLHLHVFGYNVDAQRLYRRLGYEITNINMAKKL